MRVRGRRRRINGEQGSAAQPGRPARRRGRGVRAWGPRWCAPSRDGCRSTRCGSGRGRRRSGTAIPCRTLPRVDGDAEEVTVDEPTSAEWVIGEWVTLDRELHPLDALELATVIEAVKLHVLHGWPRWWAWTFASLVAQIAIGIFTTIRWPAARGRPADRTLMVEPDSAQPRLERPFALPSGTVANYLMGWRRQPARLVAVSMGADERSVASGRNGEIRRGATMTLWFIVARILRELRSGTRLGSISTARNPWRSPSPTRLRLVLPVVSLCNLVDDVLPRARSILRQGSHGHEKHTSRSRNQQGGARSRMYARSARQGSVGIHLPFVAAAGDLRPRSAACP